MVHATACDYFSRLWTNEQNVYNCGQCWTAASVLLKRGHPLAKRAVICYNYPVIGDWPSGKATGSGPVIGGSNPSSPARLKRPNFCLVFLIAHQNSLPQ